MLPKPEAKAALRAAAMLDPSLAPLLRRPWITLEMRRFLPCLSYPMHEVDPGRDARRDGGESRLRQLRPLLQAAAETAGLKKLLDPAHPSSLASLLCPGKTRSDGWSVAERETIMDSLLKSDNSAKPCVALLRTTVRLLRSKEVDALDEAATLACVPVRNSDLVAMPDSPPVREGSSVIVVTWSKQFWSVSSKEATRSATLAVERIGPESVRFTIEAADGTRHENIIATGVPAAILTALFAPGDAVAHPAVSLSALATSPRLPASEGELPEQLQLQLAGFLQIRLRAHVLTAAAGPLQTTRPLWIENFKLSWTKPGGGRKPMMVVKGYLHSCSATCFCGAHALPEAAKRWPGAQLTGKQSATVTLQMCASALTDGSSCPTHGSMCAKNQAFAPGRCCTNASVAFACYHECRGDSRGDSKAKGTFVPCDLDPWSWKELSMLLALCASFDRRARPLFRGDDPKDARTKLTQLVVDTTRKLDRRVEAFDIERMRFDPGSTDYDLGRLDAFALARLREGGLVRAKVTPARKTPRLVFPNDGKRSLAAAEKSLNMPPHIWLFPRHGAPYGLRVLGGTAIYGLAEGSSTTEEAVSDTPGIPGVADEPLAKRPCTEDPRYAYQAITEYYSVQGLRALREQLDAILANADLPERQQRRGLHFAQFINALDAELGPEVDGPLGLPCRPLVCKYRARNDGGRLYATGMKKVLNVTNGEARSVCTQSAPREARPFFCCEFAHDYDMKNAQPEIMLQMAAKLTWTDGRPAALMPELQAWCADRPSFIDHVAEVHRLAMDKDRCVDYRKDMVKELAISLLFGGSYGRWIGSLCEDEGRRSDLEPRSPRVERLAEELLQLRTDVFESREWVSFVQKDRERLREEGKKKDDAEIDRSVMARIAQKTENKVLDAMRASVAAQGFTVLTLCFDGLHVSAWKLQM